MDPVIKKLAMTVSSNKLIWLTETPNKAGIINRRILATPSSCHAHFGFTSKPAFFKKGIWNKNCNKPPKKIPIARARSGLSNLGARKSAVAIMAILSKTGENDITPNLPIVFKIAPESATKVTNHK